MTEQELIDYENYVAQQAGIHKKFIPLDMKDNEDSNYERLVFARGIFRFFFWLTLDTPKEFIRK